MYKLLVFLFIILLLSCREQDKTMKIVYFEKGSSSELNNKEIDLKELDKQIRDLFFNTDDMLKLHVDSERISSIMKNDSGIEITFTKEQNFTSKEFGKMKVNKLLIPFSGDFVGNNSSPVITLFPANGDYYSGPLRNSRGLSQLMKIRDTILKIAQKP